MHFGRDYDPEAHFFDANGSPSDVLDKKLALYASRNASAQLAASTSEGLAPARNVRIESMPAQN
jgi:hypothetical protein